MMCRNPDSGAIARCAARAKHPRIGLRAKDQTVEYDWNERRVRRRTRMIKTSAVVIATLTMVGIPVLIVFEAMRR